MNLPLNRLSLWMGVGAVALGGCLANLEEFGWLLPSWVPVMRLTMVGAGLFVLGFAFLCVNVRCRYCGDRLFWRAVSTHVPGGGLRWFFVGSQCLKCGRSGTGGG